MYIYIDEVPLKYIEIMIKTTFTCLPTSIFKCGHIFNMDFDNNKETLNLLRFGKISENFPQAPVNKTVLDFVMIL